MKPLLITIVFLLNNPDFSRENVPGFIEEMKAAYFTTLADKPIEWKVRYVRLPKNRCARMAKDLKATHNRLFCLLRVARHRFPREQVIHFLVPPIYQYGEKWMAGVSVFQCEGSVSYSTIEERNSKGEDRYFESLVGAAHEIFHDLGAHHIDTATLMNPAPFQFAHMGYAPIDPKSLKEVNQCF